MEVKTYYIYLDGSREIFDTVRAVDTNEAILKFIRKCKPIKEDGFELKDGACIRCELNTEDLLKNQIEKGKQIYNRHCFRCGKTIVKGCFCKDCEYVVKKESEEYDKMPAYSVFAKIQDKYRKMGYDSFKTQNQTH